MKKVLVVEDEASIRNFICINLRRSDFAALEAATGRDALKLIDLEKPDAVVLDIMLPDMDGFEVCRKIRETNQHAVIIMLTSRAQDLDKIMGLELGADDYITKPFNPLELVARLRAVLRRADGGVSFEGKDCSMVFRIDDRAQKVYRYGTVLPLTPREYSLIKLLLNNPGRAYSRDEILDRIWGTDYFGDAKTVDVHIRRLREKIEDDPSAPCFIETVWGYGYRWGEG